MPPRKKVVSKKAVAKTVDDMPNVTVTRPIINVATTIDDELKDEENDQQMNVTIAIEEMQSVFKKTESSEPVIDKEESDGKKAITKKVAPKKPKTKKLMRDEDSDEKGTVNEDFQMVKVEKKVVSKSRKRPVDDKAAPKHSKSVSPINEEEKRNRRATSVDALPHPVPKENIKAVVTQEELVQKKSRKGIKPEQIKEKKVTTKRAIKKVEDKGNLLIITQVEDDNIESNDVLQGKTKPNRGVIKEQTDEHHEDVEDDAVKVLPKQASRLRGAPKVTEMNEKNKLKQVSIKSKPKDKLPQNFEESSEKCVSEDLDIIPKTPELKRKRVRKGKVNKLLEELKEKKNDDLDVAKMSNITLRRICKGRPVVEENSIAEKNIKLPKRGGRKGKDANFEEEVMQNSPDVGNIEEQNFKTEDLPDVFPDNPESGKNENKPLAVKRKTKAKK